MNDQAEKLRLLVESNNKSVQTIAVLGGKNGVGKSNIAINLALSFIKKRKRVLIIDMDEGKGNIHLLLDEEIKMTVEQCINEQKSITSAVGIANNGVHYVSGGYILTQLFSFNTSLFQTVYGEMKELMELYDFIIFDMGSTFTKEELLLVKQMEYVFIVTTPDETAITDAYSVVKYLVINQFDGKFKLIINKCKTKKQASDIMDRFQLVVERFLTLQIECLGYLLYDIKQIQVNIPQFPLISFLNQPTNKLLLDNITTKFLSEEIVVKKDNAFFDKIKNHFTTRE